MAEVTLYKMDGAKNGTIDLPDALFAVNVKPDVVHQAIVTQEGNYRARIAQAKDRSEVRGGGRKPWKQKGTGRARHGSRRSPIWVGGGVTFGPTAERNFTKKINKKMKRQALAMLLSDKVASDWFIVVDDFSMDGKTKQVVDMRAKLPGGDESALIITTKEETNMLRAAKNVPKTGTIAAQSLNVRDLAKFRYVIASQKAIDAIKETYLA